MNDKLVRRAGTQIEPLHPVDTQIVIKKLLNATLAVAHYVTMAIY